MMRRRGQPQALALAVLEAQAPTSSRVCIAAGCGCLTSCGPNDLGRSCSWDACERCVKADAVRLRGHGEELYRHCAVCASMQPVASFDGSERCCREHLPGAEPSSTTGSDCTQRLQQPILKQLAQLQEQQRLLCQQWQQLRRLVTQLCLGDGAGGKSALEPSRLPEVAAADQPAAGGTAPPDGVAVAAPADAAAVLAASLARLAALQVQMAATQSQLTVLRSSFQAQQQADAAASWM